MEPHVIVLSSLAPSEPANGQDVEIIYAGTFHLGSRGVLELTPEMLEQMVANFQRLDGPDRVQINCNHAPGSPNVMEARAVGWMVDVFAKEDAETGRLSLMGKPRWCEDVAEMIAEEQFKYLSAEIDFHSIDTLTGEDVGCRLVGVALTNIPAIPELAPIRLTACADPAAKVALTIAHLSVPASLFDRISAIVTAFYVAYPESNLHAYFVEDITDTFLIVEEMGEEGRKLWRVGYKVVEDAIEFDQRQVWVEVRQEYVPVPVSVQQSRAGAPAQQLKAVPVQRNWPKAPDDMAWDGGAARRRIKEWASPDDALDMTKYRQAFAWYDAAAPETLGSYKLPHHDVVDGSLKVVKEGVFAAAASIQGARGGAGIPEDELGAVRRHLATHYAQFGATPPWESANANAARSGREIETMTEQELRALLGIDAEADIAATVAALKAAKDEVDQLKQANAELTSKVDQMETDHVALEQAVKELEGKAGATETEALTAAREKVAELSTQSAAMVSENKKLAARLQVLEDEQAARQAKDRIALALSQGKVTRAELDAKDGFLRKMARENAVMFDGVMETRAATTTHLTNQITPDDGEPESGKSQDEQMDEFYGLVNAAMSADATLTQGNARQMVLREHPEFKPLFAK